MSFLTAKEVAVILTSLDTQTAVYRRRFNAETNTGIRDLIAADIAFIGHAKVSISNPKLLVKE